MEEFDCVTSAIDWINGARWKGQKNGLENSRALLGALDNPQNRMGKILHVAGTNGKGSVSAYLSSALIACGYNTGLFTSPYLRRFNERISLNALPIPDGELVKIASKVRFAGEKLAREGIFCTTFELLTAIACEYYAQNRTDFAVMEVGLGGRLDSTNVLPTSLSLIAAIGMDHMAILGDTEEKIAFEKAGIMKKNVPVAVMRASESVLEVFKSHAREVGAPYYECSPAVINRLSVVGSEFECRLPVSGRVRQKINIPGAHQALNAQLALTGLDLLGVDMPLAQRGIEAAAWPGRLDLRGNVLIDCAHNPQGALTLKNYVDTFFEGRKKVLLTGMMQDKQIEACSQIFATFADEIVCTSVDWPRAISPEALKTVYGDKASAVEGVKNALKKAKTLAGDEGLVIAAGSVYLAGDVINLLESDK